MQKLLIMVCVILLGSAVYFTYMLSTNKINELDICNSDVDIVTQVGVMIILIVLTVLSVYINRRIDEMHITDQ